MGISNSREFYCSRVCQENPVMHAGHILFPVPDPDLEIRGVGVEAVIHRLLDKGGPGLQKNFFSPSGLSLA